MIHIFEPVILYVLSVLVAFVASAKASDPDTGSDRQNDPIQLTIHNVSARAFSAYLPTVLVANLGKNFSFKAVLP